MKHQNNARGRVYWTPRIMRMTKYLGVPLPNTSQSPAPHTRMTAWHRTAKASRKDSFRGTERNRNNDRLSAAFDQAIRQQWVKKNGSEERCMQNFLLVVRGWFLCSPRHQPMKDEGYKYGKGIVVTMTTIPFAYRYHRKNFGFPLQDQSMPADVFYLALPGKRLEGEGSLYLSGHSRLSEAERKSP